MEKLYAGVGRTIPSSAWRPGEDYLLLQYA